MYLDEYLYSKEHEWVHVEGETCVLGVTDFAQHQLGDVVFVELPEVGQTFEADDEIGSIESVKAVAELYTPVAGEVVETNEAVVDDPEVLNSDPHNNGWLIKMKIDAGADLSGLMSADQYKEFIDGEDA